MKVRGVNFILVNEKGKILIQKRSNKKGIKNRGKYCFPGGRLKNGEDPAKGVVRECREETGFVCDFEFLRDFPYIQEGEKRLNKFYIAKAKIDGDVIIEGEGQLIWMAKEKIKKLHLIFGENRLLRFLP